MKKTMRKKGKLDKFFHLWAGLGFYFFMPLLYFMFFIEEVFIGEI